MRLRRTSPPQGGAMLYPPQADPDPLIKSQLLYQLS